MKKQLAIIGIIFILLAVELTGCNERSNNGYTNTTYSDYIQLSDFKITTKWRDNYFPNITGEQDGIYHNYPDTAYAYLEITGTVKNIGDKTVDKVYLTVNFYDNKSNLIQFTYSSVSTLYLEESKTFIALLSDSVSFFDQITDYQVVVKELDLG